MLPPDDQITFMDLETRSFCDLRAAGGHNYAADPSTCLLTVSWSPGETDDEYHVWLPGVDSVPADYRRVHLADCHVHCGAGVPAALAARADTYFVGHNAWTFDQHVWAALVDDSCTPRDWIDTFPLALACGLPGGLDQIGQRMGWGGKDEAGKAALKKLYYGDNAEDVPVGQTVLIAKYNAQDVRLTRWVWEEIRKTLKQPDSEFAWLRVHRTVNDRGVTVDRALLKRLIQLSDSCRERAVSTIRDLTVSPKYPDGFFRTIKCLQSRTKVFAYLDLMGVSIGTSLRKEIVNRFVREHSPDEDDTDQESSEDDEALQTTPANLRRVVKVLELRTAALRITHAKLDAAYHAVSDDDRMRGLFVYWGAGPGRSAGRRVQVQNLPKPKDGVNVWRLLGTDLSYDAVKASFPKDKRFRYLTPDDGASALIRTLFLGRPCTAAADLAAIEVRVLAWLAGETWLHESFWNDADPYLLSAIRMFGEPHTWPGFDPKKGAKKHAYRQLHKIIILGSGYGLGHNQFAVFAASNDIDLEELGVSAYDCILAYRKGHPNIAGRHAGDYNGQPYFRDGFWGKLAAAALHCADPRNRHPAVQVGRLTFYREGPHLFVELPSGRRLIYRDARVERVQPKFLRGTDKWTDAVVYTHPRYGRKHTYGGYWAENVVQATARDFMSEAAVRIEDAGMPVLLHVHDEVVAETRDLDRFMSAMTTLPDWADGFCLDAAGSLATRYAKSPLPGVKEVVYRNGKFHKYD